MAIILLVDDDPLQAFVRKMALEKFFPDVRRLSGPDALCLIEQAQIASQLALAISGTHMPGLSGADFVIELNARLPWLPVLVLGSDQPPAGCTTAGLIQCVPHPVSGKELLRLARHMIEIHNASAA